MIEEPNWEDEMIRAMDAVLRDSEFGRGDFPYPDKEEWIEIFTKLSRDNFYKITETFNKANNFTSEGEARMGRDMFRTFFYNIRPVIKDLKETPDSVFVYNVVDNSISPEATDELLQKRAKDHLEKFKGTLPPVL